MMWCVVLWIHTRMVWGHKFVSTDGLTILNLFHHDYYSIYFRGVLLIKQFRHPSFFHQLKSITIPFLRLVTIFFNVSVMRHNNNKSVFIACRQSLIVGVVWISKARKIKLCLTAHSGRILL